MVDPAASDAASPGPSPSAPLSMRRAASSSAPAPVGVADSQTIVVTLKKCRGGSSCQRRCVAWPLALRTALYEAGRFLQRACAGGYQGRDQESLTKSRTGQGGKVNLPLNTHDLVFFSASIAPQFHC